MKKLNMKLSSVTIICILFLSGYTPFLNNLFSSNPIKNIGLSNQYLYLEEVTQTSYDFHAQGPGYVLVEIEDIDFASFMLDDELFNVSYGLNIFPIEFSNTPDKVYTIELDPFYLQYFKTITVEPLFIAENTIEVNLDQNTTVSFQASGPISILSRINFSYNWLRVELQNETGDSTMLKRIHDTAVYPEIDPLFYCLFMERGTYIRYDVTLKPGEYTLLFQGNGTIEFKIMVNLDWDGDMFNDVDEIQQRDMYEFNLDPTNPDIWGFFEKSDNNILLSDIDEGSFIEGYFSYFIPDIYSNNSLLIRVNNGEFREVVVDMDSLFFEGEVLISDCESPSSLNMYGKVSAGWHHISYQHKANYTSDIDFVINNNMVSNHEVKVIQISEFRDTDGDGVKDLEEYLNSLNPTKADTDEDGIPDNLDSSPLAKLELDQNQIHQFVLSVNKSRDTLLNIQIKKPENDYSTNGVSRLWRGKVNVSIYPVLRLFGNKYEHPLVSQIYNLDRPALEWLWDKGVNSVFKSDKAILANYNENGTGDPLPNPVDPNSEFFFIFPKSALETIDYDIMIPKGHGSKEDGLLDLRFDFMWLLTEYDYDTGETSVLHYYDFEEPIILQSMTMREISSVHYTLGNPDCFIENQILWTLTQNPSLGSFQDFGVDDDVELNGKIDYFGLPQIISEYRVNTGYGPNDTEVLYLKGFFQNHDILNQVYVKTLLNPDFETLHQGDYSACFSSYAITNRYEDEAYFLGDSEIQGDTKILYQFYSSSNDQRSTIVMGVPIAMERGTSSHTLKISQAQGFLEPLDEIPWEGSQLSNTLTILHQTYIERDVQVIGIPLVHFEDGVDIYKEYMDNRQDEVELSHLFFTAQPEMPAELFLNYIEALWEDLALLKYNLSILYDFAINNPDFFVPGAEREDLSLMENMINEITEFQQHSNSKMSSYTKFFQFSQNLGIDAIELVDLYQGKESKNLVSSGFFKKLSKVVKLTRIVPKIARLVNIFARLGKWLNDKGVKDIPKQNIAHQCAKNPSMKTQQVKTHYRSRTIGVGCALLGVAMVIFALVEIDRLISGDQLGYLAILKVNALCNLVASFFLFVEGVLLITSSIAKATASSIKTAVKNIGKISIVLSAIMLGLNLGMFIDKVASGEDVELDMEIFNLAMSTAALVVAIAVAAGFISSGVGAIIGAVIAAVSILYSWVTKYVNAPDLEFVHAECRTFFPSNTILNMRRNGGLEVGDYFAYYLKVKNTGKNKVWMRARLKIAGDTLSGDWTDWVGDWADGKCKEPWYSSGSAFSHTLVASVAEASPNLKYELQFEADWRKKVLLLFPKRKDLADEEWSVPMNMHALENTISDFYAHTSDFGSLNALKSQFEQAIDEYRYWDACKIGETIIRAVEVNEKIPLYHYEIIEANIHFATLDRYFYYQDVYWYQTSNLYEWEYLLNNFYAREGNGGWAAWKRPLQPEEPNYEWGAGMIFGGSVMQPDTLEWNLMSYEESGGKLYTNADPDIYIDPVFWMESKEAGLSAGYEYRELIQNLIIKSNLLTDLREQHIEVDPITHKAEVNFRMTIDPYANPYYPIYIDVWPFILCNTDGEKIVEFHITPPEGYSVSPQNVFTGRLDSILSFNLTSNTAGLMFGLYFFNLSVFFNGELIYNESVPFKVGGFSCMEFGPYTAVELLVPGKLFTMVDVSNLGTLTEVVNITVEGIPENFIYEGLYPDNFINGSLFLELNPGEIKPGLIINPPRHHSTSPGVYSYTFYARDYLYNNYNEIIEGTFEVAEFYDMDFQLISITPGDTIFDYQEAIYTFNLTNLGNVDQTFHISYDDVTFANEALTLNDILLEPGAWQLVTLTLEPIGWGDQIFSINATSEYNSSGIVADITINDDDINHPEFTDFEIIGTPIELTINFEVLNENEGDDCGLSLINVFIDDVLILTYIPDPTDTCFSFTFDDTHGGWFMEYGTHAIRVAIVDNDFDVPNDALSNSTSGTFDTTLEDIHYYIDWQIEVLKEYIDTNIYSCLGRSLIKKLCCAQCQLEKAFDYVNDGHIVCGLFHDAVAKVLVQIVEFRAEFYEKFWCLDASVAEYIANSTHVIRNNIVLLMGYTTGSEIGYQIALVEIDLLNLNDLIEEQINLCCCFRWCLNNLIRSATYMLESALIKISVGCNFECCLHHALYKLEKAEEKVHWLLRKGWITQELADTILLKLNQAQADLEAILNWNQTPE